MDWGILAAILMIGNLRHLLLLKIYDWGKKMSDSTDSLIPKKILIPPPAFKVTPGMLLQNRYYIKSKLGQGGMSIIYEAIDQSTNQIVAIKQIVLPFSLEYDDKQSKEAIERLKREYQLLHSLQHNNVIRVFDLFEESGAFFLSMEIIQGVSLQEFIEQQSAPIPLVEQLAIACYIAHAVATLNSKGIIHRDIKPANIMLVPQTNRVVLLDLGLAKSLRNPMEDITATGSIVGTPEYLSPEQVNGDISDQSDIFSLGVTLYQFFSWQQYSPFKNKSPVTTMTNVITLNIPLLKKQISHKHTKFEQVIYQELSELLKKMLEKNPEHRLGNAQMACQALEELYGQLCSKQPIQNVTWSFPLSTTPKHQDSLSNLTDENIKKHPNGSTNSISKPISLKKYYSRLCKQFIKIKYHWKYLPTEVRWGIVSGIIALFAVVAIYSLQKIFNSYGS